MNSLNNRNTIQTSMNNVSKGITRETFIENVKNLCSLNSPLGNPVRVLGLPGENWRTESSMTDHLYQGEINEIVGMEADETYLKEFRRQGNKLKKDTKNREHPIKITSVKGNIMDVFNGNNHNGLRTRVKIKKGFSAIWFDLFSDFRKQTQTNLAGFCCRADTVFKNTWEDERPAVFAITLTLSHIVSNRDKAMLEIDQDLFNLLANKIKMTNASPFDDTEARRYAIQTMGLQEWLTSASVGQTEFILTDQIVYANENNPSATNMLFCSFLAIPGKKHQIDEEKRKNINRAVEQMAANIDVKMLASKRLKSGIINY